MFVCCLVCAQFLKTLSSIRSVIERYSLFQPVVLLVVDKLVRWQLWLVGWLVGPPVLKEVS